MNFLRYSCVWREINLDIGNCLVINLFFDEVERGKNENEGEYYFEYCIIIISDIDLINYM